jgi:transcriptional regulator with XRE-family HTH domain
MATSDVNLKPAYRHYLREWREHRGLSQVELGRLAHISKSVISRYESGERTIRLEAQFDLMHALDITPAQFFAPPGAPSLDDMASGLSAEARRHIGIMVKALVDQEQQR